MLLSFLGGSAGGSVVSSVLDPYLLPIRNSNMAIVQPSIMPPLEAAQQHIRGFMTKEEYYSEMRQNGYNKTRADRYLMQQGKLLDLESIIINYRKGQFDIKTAHKLANALGYSGETFAFTLEATEYLPTPQDLIRFLVREVFTPEIVTKFGQDKEFPPEAIKQGLKVGIQPEILKQFWSAHWELPSVNQVYEALYRFAPDIVEDSKEDLQFMGLKPYDVKTDFETVNLLLKTADVMPFWRSKILAISYQSLTRIDIRRMIRVGFLNYREAFVAHRKLGYTPSVAEKLTKFGYVVENLTDWKDQIKQGSKTIEQVLSGLTDWQIKEESIINLVKLKLDPEKNDRLSPYRNKTQSLIIRAYNTNRIDRATAIEYLKGINWTETDAKLILEIEDYERNIEAKPKLPKAKDLSKQDIQQLYVLGKLGRTEAIARLQSLGFSDSEAIELLIIATQKEAAKKK